MEHQYWRLVTSGFLHENLLHIAFNMYLLYLLGMMLEPALGSVKFAAIYFTSLLAGSFGALFATGAPSLGASGAVFGLMGAAVIELRARRMSVMESGIGGTHHHQSDLLLRVCQHLGRGPHRRPDRRGARRSVDQDRRRSSPLLGGLGGLRRAIGCRGRGLDRSGRLLGERNRLNSSQAGNYQYIGVSWPRCRLLDQDVSRANSPPASGAERARRSRASGSSKTSPRRSSSSIASAEAAEAANHHPGHLSAWLEQGSTGALDPFRGRPHAGRLRHGCHARRARLANCPAKLDASYRDGSRKPDQSPCYGCAVGHR